MIFSNLVLFVKEVIPMFALAKIVILDILCFQEVKLLFFIG